MRTLTLVLASLAALAAAAPFSALERPPTEVSCIGLKRQCGDPQEVGLPLLHVGVCVV